jgi:hypothetical protein
MRKIQEVKRAKLSTKYYNVRQVIINDFRVTVKGKREDTFHLR